MDYYCPRLSLEEYAAGIGSGPDQVHRMHPAAMIALYIIYTHNMRAGEYLRSTVGDIRQGDRLFIRGEKRSADYIIYLPGIIQQSADTIKTHPGRLVAGITYHKLWQNCVRAGIGMRIDGHHNAARTHMSRYLVAREVLSGGIDAVSDVLRHRSKKSAIYYVPKQEVSDGYIT